MIILILSFTNLKIDPRVYRQIIFLNKEFRHLHASGLVSPEIPEVTFHPIAAKSKSFLKRVGNALNLKLNRFEEYYWSSYEVKDCLTKLSDQHFDLIICNDSDTLPLAVRLAKNNNCKLIFDAHEYEPRHFDDRWLFRFFFQKYRDYLFRTYLPHIDGMITVCQGIADEYEKNYGIKPEVVTNCPFYSDLVPNPIQANKIRMIYHGTINRSRKTENMIYLMDLLDDRFSLDLMLMPNDLPYLEHLKELSANNSRISFIPPVSMLEISSFINQYDIGLYLLSPNSFNCKMALPNKFFEFIQARVAIAIWPSPEMARIVRDTQCGLVSDDFTIESMAQKLNQMTIGDLEQFKQQSHQAASRYCAENNRKKLVSIIDSVITTG